MRLFARPSLALANHHLQQLHRTPVPLVPGLLPAALRRLHQSYQACAQEALGALGPVLDRGLGRGPMPAPRAALLPAPSRDHDSGRRPSPNLPPTAAPAGPFVPHPALNSQLPLITLLDHAACAGLVAAAVAGPWVGLCFGARRIAPAAGTCLAVACACAVGIYAFPAGALAQGLQVVAGLLALQTRLLVQGTAWVTAARDLQSPGN